MQAVTLETQLILCRPHERRGCHHRAEDEMRRRQPPRVAIVS
jgi:hypothetical protein